MSARKNVLVTGASGLIGRSLAERLPGDGYRCVPLHRKKGSEVASTSETSGAHWDPPEGAVVLDPALPLRSVVHLAGAGIADRVWTKARKKVLRESRVDATRLLATALAALPAEQRPESLVMASGIGIYGDRGDELLNEESEPGKGFLAELASDWEAAAEPAREAGIRVVALRLGMVLSPSGGALAKMLPFFRFGMGGPVGDGWQYVSWIALPDVIGVILTLIGREDVHGAVNGVAPGCVPQRVFAREIGLAIHRPTLLSVPSFAVKARFGEMGKELLLGGQRVEPTRLLAIRYPFRYPDLQTALPAIGVV